MKTISLFILFFLFTKLSVGQNLFLNESGVITFLDGKSFYNNDNGLRIEYGYISHFNTFGITVTNKNDIQFFYINCSIDTYGSYADIFGMSAEDGTNFGFRLYKSKLIVGRGEPGEIVFNLE